MHTCLHMHVRMRAYMHVGIYISIDRCIDLSIYPFVCLSADLSAHVDKKPTWEQVAPRSASSSACSRPQARRRDIRGAGCCNGVPHMAGSDWAEPAGDGRSPEWQRSSPDRHQIDPRPTQDRPRIVPTDRPKISPQSTPDRPPNGSWTGPKLTPKRAQIDPRSTADRPPRRPPVRILHINLRAARALSSNTCDGGQRH